MEGLALDRRLAGEDRESGQRAAAASHVHPFFLGDRRRVIGAQLDDPIAGASTDRLDEGDLLHPRGWLRRGRDGILRLGMGLCAHWLGPMIFDDEVAGRDAHRRGLNDRRGFDDRWSGLDHGGLHRRFRLLCQGWRNIGRRSGHFDWRWTGWRERESDWLAGIGGINRDAHQRGDALRRERGFGNLRPVGNTLVRGQWIKVHAHDHAGILPAASQRIGIGQILAGPGSGGRVVNGFGQDTHAFGCIAGHGHRQTIIARRHRIGMGQQQAARAIGATLRDLHQRQADDRARIVVTQRHRVGQRGFGGCETSRQHIGAAQNLSIGGVLRRELHRGLCRRDRLVTVAIGQRLFGGDGELCRIALLLDSRCRRTEGRPGAANHRRGDQQR